MSKKKKIRSVKASQPQSKAEARPNKVNKKKGSFLPWILPIVLITAVCLSPMLKNNFKIVWRNLVKDRQFTALNLIGLSTGLACSLLIYLWVTDELAVNKYNEKDKQLYQVMENLKREGGVKTITGTAGLLGKTLAKEIPDIEFSVSVLPASWFPFKGVITSGDMHMKAGGQYVSSDYFNAFTVNYTEGDKNRLFADNYSVAVSEELAAKLFNTTKNVVGKNKFFVCFHALHLRPLYPVPVIIGRAKNLVPFERSTD